MMYYPNYNPFYMPNRNYYYQQNMQQKSESIQKEVEKKDTESSNDDTISFKDFYPNNTAANTSSKETKFNINKLFSFNRDNISILGFDIEIDDLIILALIFLLLRDFSENYALIIILGLILLNVNLNDILNIF